MKSAIGEGMTRKDHADVSNQLVTAEFPPHTNLTHRPDLGSRAFSRSLWMLISSPSYVMLIMWSSVFILCYDLPPFPSTPVMPLVKTCRPWRLWWERRPSPQTICSTWNSSRSLRGTSLLRVKHSHSVSYRVLLIWGRGDTTEVREHRYWVSSFHGMMRVIRWTRQQYYMNLHVTFPGGTWLCWGD